MIITDGEAAMAYTYAWWLTGDRAKAEAAVLAAAKRPEVPGADDALRAEILLRRVRTAAIDQPTMCPASEVALLHDGMGLALDSAAGLAMVDAREARTELAHGRLEALGGEDTYDVVEPQRLGGLAVGNPADVAAARQNVALGKLREMILKGRDELVGLSPVEVPTDLLERIRGEPAAPPGSDGDEGAAEDGADDQGADDQGTVEDEDADDESRAALVAAPLDLDAVPIAEPAPSADGATDLEETEEVDLSDQVADVRMPLGRPSGSSSNLVWIVIGAAFVLAVVVLLTSRGDDALPGGAVSEEPVLATPGSAAPTGDAAAVPTTEPSPTGPATPTPTDAAAIAPEDAATGGVTDEASDEPTTTPTTEPDAEGLDITEVGIAVGLGADPDDDTPVADPFDPVSFVVSYTGAGEDEVLIAEWTVDGEPFGLEQVTLLPGDNTSRFSRQVPVEEGWPEGLHVLTFTRAGDAEVLAEARFTVVSTSG